MTVERIGILMEKEEEEDQKLNRRRLQRDLIATGRNWRDPVNLDSDQK